MSKAPLAAVLLAASCGVGPPADAPRPSLARVADVTTCPQPVVTSVPRDLPLVDRRLLNLGGGQFGHKVVYQRTVARRVVVSVGDEPLDALEDLDMTEQDQVIAGRRVKVSTTHLQPGLAVVEVPARLPPSCGALFVLTERLTTKELTDVVRSVRLVDPPLGEG